MLSLFPSPDLKLVLFQCLKMTEKKIFFGQSGRLVNILLIEEELGQTKQHVGK